MSKWLDDESVKHKFKWLLRETDLITLDVILAVIDSMPEHIIRCGDCKYKGGYIDGSVKWCDRIPNADFYVDDDFFCANGERKETRG